MKIRPVGVELIHEESQTDGRTDMKKPKGVLCDYTKGPNKEFIMQNLNDI